MSRADRLLWGAPVVIVDTETTGLDPDRDRPVQLGAVEASAGLGGGETCSSWFIRWPGVSMHPTALEKHQLSAEFLNGAPRLFDVALEIWVRLHARPIVAFNAPFDAEMLLHVGVRADVLICAQALAYHVTCERFSLRRACERFRVPHLRAHDACSDAFVTARLLTAVLREGFESGKIDRTATVADVAELSALAGLEMERARGVPLSDDRSSWHRWRGVKW